MESDDDEDFTESSIHDLDHAPEEPPAHWRSNRSGGALSPLRSTYPTTTGSNRQRSMSTSDYSFPTMMQQQQNSNRSFVPNRPRSRSINSVTSLPNRRVRSPLSSLDLSHVKSFPPDSSDELPLSSSDYDEGFDTAAAVTATAAENRQVTFATARDRPSQRAMSHIPEDDASGIGEEYKREEKDDNNYSWCVEEEGESKTAADDDSKDIKLRGRDEEEEIAGRGEAATAMMGGRTANKSRSTSQDTNVFSSSAGDSATDWSEDDDDEEEGTREDDYHQPMTVLGYVLPLCCNYCCRCCCCSKRRPISWTRVCSWVANHSPFFCFMKLQHDTYRAVLVRLNIMCAFFAIAQIGSGVFLYVVLVAPIVGLDRETQNRTPNEIEQSGLEILTSVWNLNGQVLFLGIMAVIVLLSLILAVRVVQIVSLSGTIKLLWVLLWVLPLQILFLIGLFDFFRVTEVWVKFWWRDRTMGWFRDRFCKPKETANGKCTVPALETREEEDDWCRENYNGSEDCVEIRDRAQRDLEPILYSYYYANAAWGILFVFLLFLVTKTLESIITRPLMQKSRKANMPIWLLLPIILCAFIGTLYSFSSTSRSPFATDTETQYLFKATSIGPIFIAAAGLFLLDVLLAWFLRSFSILNTGDKWKKLIGIWFFIVVSSFLFMILVTIFAACIVFAGNLAEKGISDEYRGDVACFVDQTGSCSDCDKEFERCPEWSEDEVTRLLQSQAKAGAALAAVLLVYAIGSIQYGLETRKHISNYQIEYV